MAKKNIDRSLLLGNVEHSLEFLADKLCETASDVSEDAFIDAAVTWGEIIEEDQLFLSATAVVAKERGITYVDLSDVLGLRRQAAQQQFSSAVEAVAKLSTLG
jgi:hypothetical protein